MAAVPIVKLAGLLVRTVAKPMSKVLQRRAVDSAVMRVGLVWVGQRAHYTTTYLNILASGHRTVKIRTLEDEKALALGSELLGETFIFAVAGVVLVLDNERNAREKRAKDEASKRKEEQADAALESRFWRLEEAQARMEAKLEKALEKPPVEKTHVVEAAPKRKGYFWGAHR